MLYDWTTKWDEQKKCENLTRLIRASPLVETKTYSAEIPHQWFKFEAILYDSLHFKNAVLSSLLLCYIHPNHNIF